MQQKICFLPSLYILYYHRKLMVSNKQVMKRVKTWYINSHKTIGNSILVRNHKSKLLQISNPPHVTGVTLCPADVSVSTNYDLCIK